MTQLRWWKLVGVVAVVLASTAASAQVRQTSIPDRYPNLGAGARPLGMGSAFLTMPGSDVNGQFYNPASSDDFKQDWTFDVMNVFTAADSKSYTVYKDLKDMANGISDATTTSGKVAAFQTFFNNNVGKYVELDTRIIPFAARTKHWTITAITEANNVISLQNRAFPNFQMRSTGDTGLFATTAWELFEGFQAGLAVKALYRAALDKIVTTGDIVAQANLSSIIGWSQWSKGIGVGADLGAKYTLPVGDSWAPVFAVVYQDIAGTRFKSFKAGAGGRPAKIPQTVNAAVGVHPELGDFKLHLEVSGTELNQRKDLLLKTHAGAELEFPRVGPMKLSLRAGANQGYPTGGATLDFKVFRLDLLAYGEEIGMTKREKSVYHYGVEFGFKF
jgi:hypothetical protein